MCINFKRLAQGKLQLLNGNQMRAVRKRVKPNAPYAYNLQLSLICPVVCWYLNDSFFGNR